MKTIKNYGFQGDLNFRKIDKLPDNLEEIKIDEARGGYTLALGEFTNHAHTLVADRPQTKVRVLKDEQGRHYLEIKDGEATLLHGTFVAPAKIQENETDKHDVVVFPAGIYKQDFESEYDPFARQLKRVQD